MTVLFEFRRLVALVLFLSSILVVDAWVPPQGLRKRAGSHDISHFSKRIIKTEIGSPYTQMTDSILINGAYWPYSGYQEVVFTLDGDSLITIPSVWISEGFWQVSLGFVTNPASHELCATINGLECCMTVIVCSECNPRIGFVGAYNISAPTMNYFPNSTFTLDGDNFAPYETLSIWLDREGMQGTLLGTNFIIQPNGRFEVELKLPGNATYGPHYITAVTQPSQFGEYPDVAYGTLYVVQFMPL